VIIFGIGFTLQKLSDMQINAEYPNKSLYSGASPLSTGTPGPFGRSQTNAIDSKIRQKMEYHMCRSILISSFIFLSFPSLLTAGTELRWGGPGYDRALSNSSRFVARHSLYSKDEAIELLVDSESTVKEVGQIVLTSYVNGQEISTFQCRKAMRHVTAPWACLFFIEGMKQLSGNGKITVVNKSGDILIEEEIDLEILRAFSLESNIQERLK
jgi:hypothetical protein